MSVQEIAISRQYVEARLAGKFITEWRQLSQFALECEAVLDQDISDEKMRKVVARYCQQTRLGALAATIQEVSFWGISQSETKVLSFASIGGVPLEKQRSDILLLNQSHTAEITKKSLKMKSIGKLYDKVSHVFYILQRGNLENENSMMTVDVEGKPVIVFIPRVETAVQILQNDLPDLRSEVMDNIMQLAQRPRLLPGRSYDPREFIH